MTQFLGMLIAPLFGLFLWTIAAFIGVCILRLIPDGLVKRVLSKRLYPIPVYARALKERARNRRIEKSGKCSSNSSSLVSRD